MKKVLVIEDDLDTLDMVTMILQDHEFEVIPSPGGLTIQKIMDINPDIVILDYNLRDGLTNDLCQKIKSTPGTSHIPVLLYSAGIAIDRLPHNAGADAYLDKPFDLDELVNLVTRLAR